MKTLKGAHKADLRTAPKVTVKAAQVKAARAKEAQERKAPNRFHQVGFRISLKIAIKVALVKETLKIAHKALPKMDLKVIHKAILVKVALAKAITAVEVPTKWGLSREAVVNQALAKGARVQMVTLAKVAQVKKAHRSKPRRVATKPHHQKETLATQI